MEFKRLIQMPFMRFISQVSIEREGVINLGNDFFDTEKLPRFTLPMATGPTTSGVHLTRVTGATGMPSLDRDLAHP